MDIEFNLDPKRDDIKIKGSFLSDETAILYLTGIIDTYNSNKVQNEINNFIQNNLNLKYVIFHMEGVNYISSTGIGSIVEFYKTLRKNEIELYLMKVQKSVKSVFSLLGFSSLFNYIEDADDVKKVKKNIFPKKIQCPNCNANLNVIKSGSFRCSSCKHIFRVNDKGEVVENK